MGKLRDSIQGIRNFWVEVVGETKKCDWPARDELVESTTVVIAFVLVLAAAVGVFDRILVLMLERLIRLVG
jgi:preprotein translocase SecE subunit